MQCTTISVALSTIAVAACGGVADTSRLEGTASVAGGTGSTRLISSGGRGAAGIESNAAASSRVGSVSPCDPTYADISASWGPNSANSPSAAIDSLNRKLLVVVEDMANDERPTLFRCNLDGSGCTHADVSAEQGPYDGMSPYLVIDTTNAKLLVTTSGTSDRFRPALFRCDLEGTGCSFTDISAGRGNYDEPAPVIDPTHGKLLVVALESGTATPALFRCELDGAHCALADISAGHVGAVSNPSPLIDPVNGKLLVVAEDVANGWVPVLYRCALDGTTCTYADISGGQPWAYRDFAPRPALDWASGKLLVVTDGPTLFRCNSDGTECTYSDLSGGLNSRVSSAVIDSVDGKLLVITDGTDNKPVLFRCNLDGTGCAHSDISAGQPEYCALGTSAVIDSANRRLLVVADDMANGDRLALFSSCLR
jgi:hypothetical protein